MQKTIKTPVERLINSLETRIANHTKMKQKLAKEYGEKCAVQNQKISDLQIQLKALKKK